MQPGTIIASRFVIERLAGAGGMGKVYRALDREIGQVVALKFVAENAASTGERFIEEAQILASLTHPNIVRWVAHGTDANGDRWLALEWLDGLDLDARLTPGPLRLDETVTIGIVVAEALAAVHAYGIIHRDIKPSNLFLVGGDPRETKLLDFGVARRDSATRSVTRSGVVVGTAGYIPPEQVRGEPLDVRADIFGLGVVLFECIAGQPAFAGGSTAMVLRKLLLTEPPPLHTLRGDIPAELDALISSMIAKEPSARPADAAAIATALRRIFRGNGGEVSIEQSAAAAFDDESAPELAVDTKVTAPRGTSEAPTRFIGRERDVSTLVGLFEQCTSESVARTVLIAGPAGIGKSRLWSETRQRIEKMATNAHIWTAHARVGDGAVTFSEADPPLRPTGRETAHIAPEILPILHAALERGPLVLVLEDFQWANELTLKAIDGLLARLAKRPLFVVTIARSEAHVRIPRLWADHDVQEMLLNGLARRNALELVQSVVGGRADASVFDAIIRRGAGHPSYLEELARAAATGQHESVPDTVLATVHGFLAGLRVEERRFLRAACLFGDVFWARGVLHVLGGGSPDVARTLVERRVLTRQSPSRWVGEEELSFREPIVGEAIRRLLSPDARSLGEGRAKAWLASMGSRDSSETDEPCVGK